MVVHWWRCQLWKKCFIKLIPGISAWTSSSDFCSVERRTSEWKTRPVVEVEARRSVSDATSKVRQLPSRGTALPVLPASLERHLVDLFETTFQLAYFTTSAVNKHRFFVVKSTSYYNIIRWPWGSKIAELRYNCLYFGLEPWSSGYRGEGHGFES